MRGFCGLMIVWLLTLLPGAPARAEAVLSEAQATLVVEITNLRSDDGQVLLTLYASEDGWVKKPAKAKVRRIVPIHEGKARERIEALSPGGYAVAVVHDENASGAMDRNWIGIPKEGYGFSNDAIGSMGPPSFKAARFDVKGPETTIRLRMRY